MLELGFPIGTHRDGIDDAEAGASALHAAAWAGAADTVALPLERGRAGRRDRPGSGRAKAAQPGGARAAALPGARQRCAELSGPCERLAIELTGAVAELIQFGEEHEARRGAA
jgi:hypothetical protein